MPLVMDAGRVPTFWPKEMSSRAVTLIDRSYPRSECISVAIINNMPDSALVDTDLQFCELLENASGDIPIYVRLYSLPEINRSDRVEQYLSNSYFHVKDLFNRCFDAVIMTGTEPLQSDLRKEAYWPTLVKVLDWAENNTISAVLSCLAAHASVLYSDGIDRHTLSDKQFGVFDYRKSCEHALTSGTADLIQMPQSRWNEVRADALTECGYEVLTKGVEAGVDLFVKQKKRSLFVHFQGHPEYGIQTLFKEYRRDVRRFLRKERETYPSMPRGYFDTIATKLLNEFREKALSAPTEELLAVFPGTGVVETLQKTWHRSAVSVYRNWIEYVASRKADTSSVAAASSRTRAVHAGQ